MILGQLAFRDPSAGARVIGRAGGSGRGDGHVVDQDVMVLGAAVLVSNYSLEDFELADGGEGESGLFQDLAAERFLEGFAGFDSPARQRPLPCERSLAATDQEDRVVLKNQGSDADNGARGIAAAIRELLICWRRKLFHGSTDFASQYREIFRARADENVRTSPRESRCKRGRVHLHYGSVGRREIDSAAPARDA